MSHTPVKPEACPKCGARLVWRCDDSGTYYGHSNWDANCILSRNHVVTEIHACKWNSQRQPLPQPPENKKESQNG